MEKKENKKNQNQDEIVDTNENGSETPDKSGPVNGEAERVEGEVIDEAQKTPEDELTEKEDKILDLTDKLQRTLAEFDNFRKRNLKEKAGMYDDGIRDTLEKLLPVYDNFERALGSAAPDNSGDNFYKGVEMIFKQLSEIMESLGVKEIPAVGEPFDHNRHFAVAHVDDPNYGENVVIEAMQKGYLYKDRVLRCSMVKVAN